MVPDLHQASGGAVVWSDRYLEYAWTPEHPMNPVRLDLTMRLASALKVLDGVELLDPDPASDQDLLRIHSPAYIEMVKHAPAQPGSRATAMFGLGNDDNPIFARMHEASSVIVGGTLRAAQEIAAGRARRAVSIGGGMHHAMRNNASGFCVYNDVAVAITWLLDHGFDRIAYIDVDVHHGDGVQRAFEDDPRVLTISIHQHPATLWPGTGYPNEVGTGRGEGSVVNLALQPGTTDRYWLRGFHAVVPGAVAAFRPQIVVSQCGVDSHREDPLADLSLTVDGQRAAFRAMRDLADTYAEGRWLAVGGGGYGVVRVVPRAWTHLLAAALDRDLDVNTPIPREWRDHVLSRAPHADLPETMSDGGDITFPRWDGPGGRPDSGVAQEDRDFARLDTAVLATRRAVFPLLGLDPDDRRD
ncbi:MAG: acetoin utilization protein AcuC [Nocardiaceae bacterium]|nr:acetoin utilization protein AcuC [Nocardiaceae bacterium]